MAPATCDCHLRALPRDTEHLAGWPPTTSFSLWPLRPIWGYAARSPLAKIQGRAENLTLDMRLKDQLQADLSAAMKARQQLRLDTLRMAKSAIKNREIAEMRDLSDAEVSQILRSLIKQRKESVEQYLKAGRKDLADKEAAEIEIIQNYLPPELSQEQLEKLVEETIIELGNPSLQEMGFVMKTVMGKLSGQRADGKLVNLLVRARLRGPGKPA